MDHRPNMPRIMRKVMHCLTEARHNGELILDAHNHGDDGRVRSIYLKSRVISYLRDHGFHVKAARTPRDWFSFVIHDVQSGIDVPCNITISSGGCDNFHNKHAIVYSCADVDMNALPKTMSYTKMFDMVRANLREVRNRKREYYMIFLHKHKPSVVVRSLCDVVHFRPNPSNHLQINWSKELNMRGPYASTMDTPSVFFERIRQVLVESYEGMHEQMRVVTEPMEA